MDGIHFLAQSGDVCLLFAVGFHWRCSSKHQPLRPKPLCGPSYSQCTSTCTGSRRKLKRRVVGLFGVIGANMGSKLFIALGLEVAHHFTERHAGRRSRSLEPPETLGATKAPKMLLLNPYQLPAHGDHILQAQIWTVCRACYGRAGIRGPGFGVKRNHLGVSHASRVVGALALYSGEAYVRYPTETRSGNLYTPPG
jgi:hypothetical protein